MKATVNATLSFGLVTVPVGVASAVTSTNEPSFKTLHQFCKNPIKIKTVGNEVKKAKSAPATSAASPSKLFCEVCNVEVEAESTAKGYEYAKGDFVLFTEEELASVAPERSPTIKLNKFVKATELHPSLIEKLYFLIPNQHVGEGYGLLYQALAELKSVGIGMQSLWGKEHPCAIIPNQQYATGGVLTLATLRLQEDLLAPDFAAPIPNRESKKIAKEVVTSHMGTLDPATDLVSGARSRLHSMISAKIEGRDLSVEAAEADAEVTGLADLQEMLRRSVAEKVSEKKEKVKA